jgi:hypothetical protein
VERSGIDVDYLEVRTEKPILDGVDLKPFNTVLLGERGIAELKPTDIQALRKYAEAGGRVIVTADYFFRGTVTKANQLLLPYGLEMQDTESKIQNELSIEPEQITICPLTDGVKALSFRRASPSEVLDKDRTMVLVASPTNPNEHLVAIAQAGDGQIVSLGVSLWWLWIGQSDNAVLFENMLKQAQRKR